MDLFGIQRGFIHLIKKQMLLFLSLKILVLFFLLQFVDVYLVLDFNIF